MERDVLMTGRGWGFCAMRSPLAVCRRRVGGLDGVNPPIAGGEARGAVRCSHVNPLLRVITRYFACGQGCLRSY